MLRKQFSSHIRLSCAYNVAQPVGDATLENCRSTLKSEIDFLLRRNLENIYSSREPLYALVGTIER